MSIDYSKKNKIKKILHTSLISLIWCFLLFFYNIGGKNSSYLWTFESYLLYLLEFGSILWILSSFNGRSNIEKRKSIIMGCTIVFIVLSANYVIMVLSRTNWYFFLMFLGGNIILLYIFQMFEEKLKVSDNNKKEEITTFTILQRVLITSLVGITIIVGHILDEYIFFNSTLGFGLIFTFLINMVFAIILINHYNKKWNTTHKFRNGILIISIYIFLLLFILIQLNDPYIHRLLFEGFSGTIRYGTDFFINEINMVSMQIFRLLFILAYLYLLFRLIEHFDKIFSSIAHQKQLNKELLKNQLICPFCYELVSFNSDDKNLIQSQGYLICTQCKKKILKIQIEQLDEKELLSQHDELLKSLNKI